MSAHKAVVEQYFDGFRRSDHKQILDLLTDDVVWDLPGFKHLAGKAEFDAEIENPDFGGRPALDVDRLVEDGDTVVAIGRGAATHKEAGEFRFAFCTVLDVRRGPHRAGGVVRGASAVTVDLADEASWDGVEVSGSFAGAVASLVDVNGCRLTGAVFTGAEIDKLRLVDTVIEDCEFSGAVLNAALGGAGGVPAVPHVRGGRPRGRLPGCAFRGLQARRGEPAGHHVAAVGVGGVPADRGGLLLGQARGGGDKAVRSAGGRISPRVRPQVVTLYGSELEGIIGAEGLWGVVIGGDQVIPLALAVFSALRIRVEDEQNG